MVASRAGAAEERSRSKCVKPNIKIVLAARASKDKTINKKTVRPIPDGIVVDAEAGHLYWTNHDVAVSGQFKQDFGLVLRVTKLFQLPPALRFREMAMVQTRVSRKEE